MADEPNSDRPLFFLTNRMNLNAILGSRLIAPREAYQKHYADLLDLTPRWVPLLTAPPAKAQLDIVTAERGSGSAVLVELAGDVGKGEGSVPADGAVYLRAAKISDARAIHFPDERSLREHRARLYGNVHPHDDLLRVTPELFSGDGVEVAIASPGGTPSPEWRRVDRIRGAASAAVGYATTSGRLGLAASVLGTPVDDPGIELPSWLNWTALDDLFHGESKGGPASPDAVTFAAVYDALTEFDVAGSWSPGAVLSAVVERVEAASLTDDDLGLVMRNLQRVRQLVDAEVEFEPFRSTGSALLSAKALILVLLRPSLADLLAWPDSETGADPATQLVAAIFSGRLRGLAREDVSLRSLRFDDATASWAVRVAAHPGVPASRIDFVWDGPQVSIAADAIPEVGPSEGSDAGRVAAAESVAVAYAELGSRSKAAARLRVARKLGWPVTTVVKVPPGSEVISKGNGITVVGIDAVKLVESITEADFLALASAVDPEQADDALTALRPRRR
ncbi:MAG: hypothetical protein FWE71_02535 [Nocardioidaceae bacterium]|nr:hypothetical protein [Nocardioidaceae bacterium]MCL2611664.1 hypothetical protein [Nocardioidaceae bacterium]